jgi:hypothetical protein
MDVQIYHLPNHSWYPADWVKPGSKYDIPGHVLRRVENRVVLVRRCTWEQAKEPRYCYSKEFCGENRPNDTWKSVELWLTGTNVIGILAQRASDGDANAGMELARLASESTARLNKILKRKPELVRELARVRRAWPIIKKRNADLSEDERDLFAAIQLGRDDFIELDAQTAKWRFDDAGLIAYGLLSYVRDARSKSDRLDYGTFGKLTKRKLNHDFDEDSSLDWWNFAKRVLLCSYPEPQAIDEFKNLVPLSSPKRKSPGRLKQAILRVLKSRFLSFARNTSFDRNGTCPTSRD